jgi:cytochrome c553
VLSAAELNFQVDIRPIVQARCGKCHGSEEKSGNIDFSVIADDQTAARQRKLWRKVLAQLESEAMPPKEAPQLTAEEKQRLLAWMKRTIDTVNCDDATQRDPGPTVIRRLSLSEYNRTVRDLMGFDFDAAATVGMTDDAGEENSFGNLAAALDMPPALLEKYFAAADQILDRFFGTELSSSVDGRIQEQARNSRELMFLLKPGDWRKADYEVAPPPGVEPRDAARSLITAFARRAYRGQFVPTDIERLMVLYDRSTGLKRSYGDSIRVMLKAVLVSPKFLFRIESHRTDVMAGKVVQVTDHELAVRLSYFLWSSMPDDELLELADRSRLTTNGPSTETVKLNGKPIPAPGSESFQGNNRDKAFDGDLLTQLDGPDANSHWIGLDLGASKPISRVRFAGRVAYEQRMVGGKFQASSTADFSSDVVELFEVTQAPPRGWVTRELDQPVERRYVRYVPPKNSFGNIAEFEVRGRTSGTVLEQQVRRMLADPRARSLTHNFAVHWLQIHKLPVARPSTEFFPEFNANIRQAMFDETTMFFDSLRREDRSVLELLDSDYTFVNEELAKYYGLQDVKGKELQRVSLKPDDHRGGLLGMGSVLAVTSHTSRTSPTMRGKWILEVVFGTPPPPPPANVSQIKDEPGKKKTDIQTFREKLSLHAQDAACAGCHRKMDPLGFALDNYNAVGRWRDKLGDQPLDVTGELPTGEKLNGAADLKRVILARKDEFVINLTEQLLTFALGRELEDFDDCPVRQIATQLKTDEYRFSTLVMEIVKSYPFQYRKNQAEQ